MKIPRWEQQETGRNLVEQLQLETNLKISYQRRAQDLARRNLMLHEEVKRLRKELERKEYYESVPTDEELWP